MMILETKRTILRAFNEHDLNDLYEYSSQDGVGEMAGWRHHVHINESKRRLTKNISNPNMYAIELKKNSKVIGCIAINEEFEENREDTKELSFILNRDYHNQGIMTEVIQRILAYLFDQGIEYVVAVCFQHNLASKRLIEKCGFVFEKEGVFYFPDNDEEVKTFEYLLTLSTLAKNIKENDDEIFI